ncbi:MAG: hypothetical protein ACKOZM_01185 [Flavobacteriales bacterium]
MKNKLFISIVACFLIVQASSCRKERRDTLGSSISTDNSTAENMFSDMFKVVDDVSSNTAGIREENIGCIDTLIVDTLSNPKTILIDFGDDACAGNDGRTRTGILHITYTGRYREPGTVITITPENYRVNNHLVEGQKTIANMGFNANGQLYYTITANGTVTEPSNAWTISWSANRTRTWVEGQDTPSRLDDVYEITGGSTGVNRNGVNYTSTITAPLRAEFTCAWIVSGQVTIEPEDYATRYIDFGNGECNNGFTVTVNGETYQLGSD